MTAEEAIVQTLCNLRSELMDLGFTEWQRMRLLTAAMPEITRHYLKGQ